MKTRTLLFMATGSPVGGVATWLDRACSELNQRGFELTVALVRGQRTNDPETFRQFHPLMPVEIVDGRGLNREARIRACNRLIGRIKPQLVLPLGVLDAADAAFMFRVSSRRPLHVIGRAQGNLPPMLADLEDRRTGFDHVVCVGEMTRRYLIRHAGFAADRVCHIPNGANFPTHPRHQHDNDSPLRLGFVGRLTNGDKRVLDIPPFCQVLADLGVPFQLTIVGSGPCEGELREKLARFGDQVRFTGALPGAQVYANVYPNLDILLLFSSSETFGIVLAEAMMNGAVPVSSRYVGSQAQRLVLENEHGLAFDVGDIQEAARCVKLLHEDRSFLKRLSQQGREKATHVLSWTNCFDAWAKVLHEIHARTPVSGCPPVAVRSEGNVDRLDRLRLPGTIRDGLRRLRRKIIGSPVPPGGEEWPLFNRKHSAERLARIELLCHQLEREATNDHRAIRATNH